MSGRNAALAEAAMAGILWPIFVVFAVLGTACIGLIFWIAYRLLTLLVFGGAP